MHGPLPGRGDDIAGIAMGYGWVSGSASEFDQQTAFYSNTFLPGRTGETFIELTYQYQLTPAVQLQPDFQYCSTPAAGPPTLVTPAPRLKTKPSWVSASS